MRIVNLASGDSRTVPVVEGGFDPVAITAAVGDTLEIVPFKGSVAQPTIRVLVPPRRPPVVVRTDPPDRKTKVPLNASLLVVFSEPIESGTVADPNVRLVKDGILVPADVAMDSSGLRAEVRPDSPLLPQTEYRLVMDTGVTDLSGDPLEQGVEVTFTTTEATLSVTPPAASIAVGVRLQLTVRLTNSAGRSEALPPVTWSSSDSSVVTVSPTGVVTGIREGVVDIRAAIDGQEAATTVTIVAPSGTTIVELTAGRNHTCGLTHTGLAYCWGANHYGQLGDGAGGVGISQPLPVPVAGGYTFAMLAAGAYHTCGLTVSGAVVCWGQNDQGELGDGSRTDHDTPAQVAGSDVYVAVTAGLNHTCARSATDTYCWGLNDGYVFGEFNFSFVPRRVETTGDLRWAPIDFQARRDSRDSRWCPLIIYGGAALFCWGQPLEGRAALDLATLSIPHKGGAFPRVVDIAIDAESGCTVTLGGGAWCRRAYMFNNFDFQHDNGLGVEVCVGSTCSVPGFDVSCWYLEGTDPWENRRLFSGTSLLVSGHLHSCALTLDGAAYCWGAADRGQLGRPATDLISDARWQEAVGAPDPVVGDLTFATLAAGEHHTCGITWSGETYCWGANEFGQLGDGTQADRFEPVRVSF